MCWIYRSVITYCHNHTGEGGADGTRKQTRPYWGCMEPVTLVVQLLVKREYVWYIEKWVPCSLCLRNTHHAGWHPQAKIDAHGSLPQLPFWTPAFFPLSFFLKSLVKGAVDSFIAFAAYSMKDTEQNRRELSDPAPRFHAEHASMNIIHKSLQGLNYILVTYSTRPIAGGSVALSNCLYYSRLKCKHQQSAPREKSSKIEDFWTQQTWCNIQYRLLCEVSKVIYHIPRVPGNLLRT